MNLYEALEVSWSSQSSYNHVNIEALFGQASVSIPVSGTAYLTSEIGANATPATEIASADFTFPNATGGNLVLFRNLSLTPGTYYLVLYSTSLAGGGWQFSTASTDNTDAGVTIGNSGYFYDPGMGFYGPPPYPPVAPFFQTFPNENFVFEMDGDRVSPISPEPSSLGLIAAGALLIGCALHRRRQKRLAKRF